MVAAAGIYRSAVNDPMVGGCATAVGGCGGKRSK